MKTALSIAGSDCSGGAGIQADLKTMTLNGVFAMSAITALTAQNTTGVSGILEVSPAFLAQQIDAVFSDIRPDAVKIGIHSREEMLAAARAIAFDCDCSVLLKGGHSDTDADDLLVEADGTETWFAGRRIANPNTHGTGCTLSSAIAANLAKGYSLPQAIARAKGYITAALSAWLDLGAGSGPLDHTLGGKDIFTWMNGAPDAIQE